MKSLTVFLLVGTMWAQTPRAATLAQQKECANQAAKVFQRDKETGTKVVTSDYTSHYDPKANICYVRIMQTLMNGKVPSTSDVVYDAFERRVYANYLWINSEGKKYWEVSPMECAVHPIGKDEITCKSAPEFDELVEDLLGIGK